MSDYEMEGWQFDNLAGNEMRARLSVWAALAQLFHGRQLGDVDYDRLAGELLAAGQTAESARYILIHDVAPVFYEKLFVMGGDGTRWPASVVETMMRDFRSKSDARRARLKMQAAQMSRNLLRGGWEPIELRLRLAGLIMDEA